MAKTDRKFLLLITTVIVNTLAGTQFCLAQSRPLPKSNFNSHFGGPVGPAGGVSLQEGSNRAKNAPAEVYNPGEPKLGHKLVHWEKRFMPLKVWISPGKKLIEEPIQTINAQRPQEVYNMLNSDRNAVAGLQQCASWSPDMNQAATQGIEQWREFQNEGLFSFEFVNDPGEANILLFWADRLTGDESTGGVSTGGNTVAVLYDANQVHQAEARTGKPVHGTPVIIEVVANVEFEKLQARIAHEFGHALGIKEHSPYNDDLMCVNGIAKYLSPSDKATVRWLYRQPPAFLMLPPRYSSQPVMAQQPQQSPDEQQPGAGTGSGGRPGGYRIRTSGPATSTGGGASDPETADSSQQENGGGRTYKLRPRPPVETSSDDSGDGQSPPPPQVYKSRFFPDPNDVVDEKDKKKKDRDEEKDKKKEKKSKKNKDSDSGSNPSPVPTQSEPPPKASEGY